MIAREMYAELLIKTLANTIYGDPPVARADPLIILDLGSRDINGCYRPLFALPP